MSVNLLLRAARTLRELAEGATPGPWLHVDYAGSSYPEMTFMGCGSVITMGEDVMGGNIAAPNGDLYPRSGYSPLEDMAYVALMHPPVALALAELLETAAFVADGNGLVDDDRYKAEDALARTILREPS